MRPEVRNAVFLITLAIVALGVPETAAQAARVSLVVMDVDGKPIEGVTITVTNPAKESDEIIKVTNKKGKVTITHLDSFPTYTYKFEKEGYQILTTQVHPDYTETSRLEFTLRPQKVEVAAGVPHSTRALRRKKAVICSSLRRSSDRPPSSSQRWPSLTSLWQLSPTRKGITPLPPRRPNSPSRSTPQTSRP
jgi:hypothetical protein